jgi:hypothetical protein
MALLSPTAHQAVDQLRGFTLGLLLMEKKRRWVVSQFLQLFSIAFNLITKLMYLEIGKLKKETF